MKHVVHVHQQKIKRGEDAIIDRTYKGSTHHRRLEIICPCGCGQVAAVVVQGEIMPDDIINRLLPFIHDEMRMPAGMIKDVIQEIERLRAMCDMLATRLRSGSDSGWDDAIDAWEDVGEFWDTPESQGSAKLSPNSETNVDDTIQSDSVKSLIHDVNKASKGMSISDMDNPGSPIRQVIAAFTNPGQHPEYHEYRKAGLRKEWPALWAALNKLVDEYQR